MIQEIQVRALEAAIVEARQTPLEIGTMVGHTNVLVYGSKPATLLRYEGEYMVVVRPEGSEDEEILWAKDGTVSLVRVKELANDLMATAMDFVKTLSTILGVPIPNLDGAPVDDVGGDTSENGLLADDPTPGCTCPYCSTFTTEQHDAARHRQDEFLKQHPEQNDPESAVGDPFGNMDTSINFDDPFLPGYKKPFKN